VVNAGVPGEELITSGVFRLPSVLRSSRSDILFILEGANDAVKQASTGEYTRSLQKAINVGRAEGRRVIIATLLPPTDEHAALGPFTNAYSISVRDLSRVNDIPFVDAERAWSVTCPDIETCSLYNLPEGLHPNSVGYDALAQTIAATLVGVDIFAPNGPADLESALGLPAGSVVVKAPGAP
jgi:lysophospholipase L1-like esterase